MLKRLREWVATALAANFTTTSTTPSTIFSFNIAANEIWVVDVQITAQCSSTGGTKYQVAAPAGATIEGWLYSSLGAVTTLSYQRITAINTLNATAVHIVATTPAPDVIRFTITNSSTPGTVAVQAASVTSGQTTTVFAKSSIAAYRAA
jgi:hypothetical protein